MSIIFQLGNMFWIEEIETSVLINLDQTTFTTPPVALERSGIWLGGSCYGKTGTSNGLVCSQKDATGGGLNSGEFINSITNKVAIQTGQPVTPVIVNLIFMRGRRN